MVRAIKTLGILIAGCAVLILALRMMFPLPDRGDALAGEIPPDTADTPFHRQVAPLMAAHPGLSGVLPIETGLDAFAARVHLIRNAAATIDAQYYIWQDDLTGIRLLAELQDAARRGVRVRLLVDDNGTSALDQELAALDALPAAQVRLFNPFTLRDHRIANYAFDFFRLNRRMHTKSLTVDNIMSIVGGRNIGDVYFETGAGHTYLDLDILAMGPVARDVGADFDRYWSSGAAYPAGALIALQPGAERLLDDRDAALRDSPQAGVYAEAVRSSPIGDQIDSMTLPVEWVPALLLSDDPAKAEGEVDDEDLMIRQLMAEIGTPDTAFDAISAYFVAGESATERILDLAARNVRVRILTNSLEATDVVPVHAGYSNFRETLVRGGVEVYELRSEAGDRRTVNELGILELSKSALHAKSFAIDGRRAFIGSLNFDPRSKRLNTEMGLLIDSPLIAKRLSDWLDVNLPGRAYRVSLDGAGRLIWTLEGPDGQATVFDTEPNTTLPLRLVASLMSYLPIQWLL